MGTLKDEDVAIPTKSHRRLDKSKSILNSRHQDTPHGPAAGTPALAPDLDEESVNAALEAGAVSPVALRRSRIKGNQVAPQA
jgi:hypothetical protein